MIRMRQQNPLLLGWRVSRAINMAGIWKFRFTAGTIKKSLNRLAVAEFPAASVLSDRLKIILGDFSGFRDCVSESLRKRIIEAADQYVDGYYDILGSGPTKLKPIDWHKDFRSGKIWPPGKFYKDYVQVDLSDNSDVKIPRELSRSHHLLILGQAYLITGESRYSIDICSQLEHWIEQNPFMHSINWGCAMDVAIRAVNWLYALNMIVDSEAYSDALNTKVLSSLLEHGYYVFNNLEKSFRNSNNHYMSDLVGLVFLGSLFENLQQGKAWKEFAIREFFTEIRYQILPSGVSYELSIFYHRLMTELVFYTALHLERNNIRIPMDVRVRIRRMLDFVMNYIKPNGHAPIIGDQDNGRFLPFGTDDNLDHSYLLSLAMIEYGSTKYGHTPTSGIPEVFFLKGSEGVSKLAEVKPGNRDLASRTFADAGFCVLRAPRTYCFISNSGAATYPDQTDVWGSHSHADMLSLELSVDCQDFIVDPGTFAYTSDAGNRNLFRSGRMHNTVIIDGIDQQEFPPNEIFRCSRISTPLLFEFVPGEDTDQCIASHDAYLRLADPVDHIRRFDLHKPDSILTVRDVFNSKGRHKYEWFLHFDTGVEIELCDNAILVHKNAVKVEIKYTMPDKVVLDVLNDFVSKSYGVKTPSQTLRFSIEHIGSFTTTLVFIPKESDIKSADATIGEGA